MAIKDMLVVRCEVPMIDGCPAIGRIKAFVVDQGVKAILEHQFTDRQGKPLDLSSSFDDGQSISQGANDKYTVMARIKEPIASGPSREQNPIWELNAWVENAAQGLVRVRLNKDVVEQAGIYEVGFAILDEDGDRVVVNDAFMSVEQGLWANSNKTLYDNLGPPTLREIRQTLVDTCPADNLLLDQVEFTTDQIIYAIIQPVEDWNVALPPLKFDYTTRNFPYRNPWKEAIVGHLLVAAAHNYRRNHLAYSAGGTAIDDKNKEQPYLQMGLQLLQGYKDFVLNKKVAINMGAVAGSIGSPFGSRFRR